MSRSNAILNAIIYCLIQILLRGVRVVLTDAGGGADAAVAAHSLFATAAD